LKKFENHNLESENQKINRLKAE